MPGPTEAEILAGVAIAFAGGAAISFGLAVMYAKERIFGKGASADKPYEVKDRDADDMIEEAARRAKR